MTDETFGMIPPAPEAPPPPEAFPLVQRGLFASTIHHEQRNSDSLGVSEMRLALATAGMQAGIIAEDTPSLDESTKNVPYGCATSAIAP